MKKLFLLNCKWKELNSALTSCINKWMPAVGAWLPRRLRLSVMAYSRDWIIHWIRCCLFWEARQDSPECLSLDVELRCDECPWGFTTVLILGSIRVFRTCQFVRSMNRGNIFMGNCVRWLYEWIVDPHYFLLLYILGSCKRFCSKNNIKISLGLECGT